jgi:hypothetical protein
LIGTVKVLVPVTVTGRIRPLIQVAPTTPVKNTSSPVV